MNWDYEFELPFPPSVNSIRACVRNRLITSKKGREYWKMVKDEMDNLLLSNEMIDKPVLFHITFHPPTKRKYDVSNFLKALEDSLVKCGFIEDDNLIEYSGIRKGEKISGGKALVRVKLTDTGNGG